MLNYDEDHYSFKEEVKEKASTFAVPILISAVTLMSAISIPIISYAKHNSPCDINGEHAHLYVDPDTKIERYIESERDQYGHYGRLDEYRMITPEEAEELKFVNKHDLVRVDDNRDQLMEIEQQQKENHQEYRYKYTETIRWSTPMKVGKTWTVTQHHKDVTRYSWTTDQNKNLTGETRDVEYKYYGYKVYKDEKGKYQLEKSEMYDSLEEIPEEYEYVGRNFYQTIDPLTKEVLSYEDGRIEDARYENKEVSEENVASVDLEVMLEDEDIDVEGETKTMD